MKIKRYPACHVVQKKKKNKTGYIIKTTYYGFKLERAIIRYYTQKHIQNNFTLEKLLRGGGERILNSRTGFSWVNFQGVPVFL